MDFNQIAFNPMPGIDGLDVFIFDVDMDRQIVDAVFRFPPDQLVANHRHVSQTNMLILEGELVIYEPDGSVRDRRKAGKYFSGTRDDTHTEGGGSQGAIVLYSVRGHGDNKIIDILGEGDAVIGSLTFQDVAALHAAQA